MVSQKSGSFFTVPAGMSPGGLLETPGMFLPPNTGPFGISHQQALAQVTAQTAQSHPHMQIQAEFPSSFSGTTMASSMPALTSDANNSTYESTNGSHYDQRSQPPPPTVDKPVDDGYNWRKYGQKQVKGSEYPRSYYKCTYPNCPVTKKVERSLEGQVTEIIYKGHHNHQKPASTRRGKEGALPNGSHVLSTKRDFPAESFSQGGEIKAAPSTSKKDRESAHGISEQLSASSDGEEVGNAELGTDDVVDSEPGTRKRIVESRAATESASHRTVTEPRIIVQTTSEVDVLDDGYRWRKYGQKVVKGNPHPRSYYKCTYAGCTVRKHVERASTDPKAVITAYEGKHNHDLPQARNSSHNTAAANNSQPVVPNSSYLSGAELRDNVQRPVAVLRLKREHDLT
nr:WRKY transcription factor 27 [Crocus sativus]